MQQDTYLYQNFPQDPRLQYPSTIPYPDQANPAQWPGNYVQEVDMNQTQNVQNQLVVSNQFQPTSNMMPASTAVYCSTPTFSWAHTVPSLMPWMAQCGENVPDPIMRFTAPFPPDPCTSQTATSWELLNNLGANKTNVNMHLKRKNDLEVLETAAPNKMCITEEKMAARLRNLHISNQFSVPVENSPFGLYGDSSDVSSAEKSVTNLQEFEAMLRGSSIDGSSKSLVLAPELKKLVEPDKLLASTFLEKVERPSMAVVLWQPPNKLVPNVNNNNSSDSKGDEERKESKVSSDALHKVDNNNYLSHPVSAIRNQNSPFSPSPSRESSGSVICEDVMDT